ncbi:uncharacterized protein LOC123404466 [Hordeum vulgare subsp. vulgare]|uniref:uncharacterized protein LOC123404466 n=1 Tax=Hordeum vulgare subsp. vulgare TaxID=112509 RepID=UPI001D1A3819|nr:uncharacterized protein LOC123404466 [Hordeum vulgare subsp. vulgare]XP_044954331.1 uncharacterized protein LOC123404466 [Hordeum vulgare subsp. vulgare]XP_044954332.1 uncharacterized protein LOC123404466 [Hordeum vulgare subsp. vulgare]XP_044954333.1 uncharacterized protein LOC123404466 [Hordeum vulgare subsp. vulgare]
MSEGTHDSAIVIINIITLVNTFLHATELFPSIVCKSMTIQVTHHGAASGHHGSGSLRLVITDWCFRGYIEAVGIGQQNQLYGDVQFDDIVVACGSGGTTSLLQDQKNFYLTVSLRLLLELQERLHEQLEPKI